MKKLLTLLLILPFMIACSDDKEKEETIDIVGTVWSDKEGDKVLASLSFSKEEAIFLLHGNTTKYTYQIKDKSIWLYPKSGGTVYKCNTRIAANGREIIELEDQDEFYIRFTLGKE